MRPVGAPLKLDYSWFNGNQSLAWANGSFVAVVPNAIEVVDGASLRVSHRYAFRHKGTCAVDFDGTAVVALTGCLTGSPRYTVWRLTPTSRRAIRVSGLDPLAWPVSFAVGDGHWFVARSGGTVDAIDLQTGRVTSHRSTASG